MLGKKIVSFKKLAKKVKANKLGGICTDRSSSETCYYHESLLREFDHQNHDHDHDHDQDDHDHDHQETPTGFLAVYAGEERRRFVVPTSFLSHPLFKILLEKAQDEFGFGQPNGLVVPCSVATFQEVISAVQCNNGRFDFGSLVEDLI